MSFQITLDFILFVIYSFARENVTISSVQFDISPLICCCASFDFIFKHQSSTDVSLIFLSYDQLPEKKIVATC